MGLIIVGDVEVVMEVGVDSGDEIVAAAVVAENAVGYNVAFGRVVAAVAVAVAVAAAVVVVRELQVS